MDSKVRILVVEDEMIIGAKISMQLTNLGYEVSGLLSRGEDVSYHVTENRPDIILLDINLPDIDGLELCATIRKTNKVSKIIGLTSTNEAGIITQLLAKGGNGYLLKNMERSELISAINEVLEGKIFLSKAANQKILEQFNSVNHALENTPVLTRREKEILQLLHNGLNGPQIAEKLFLSPYTIETHRKHLMQKFNVNTTQLLLKNAAEQKLI